MYWLVTVCSHGEFYSAAPLGHQATSTMIWYPTQSHYRDTEPISPFPILVMPSTCLGSDKYQFYKSLVWFDQGSSPPCSACEACALPIRPPRSVPWGSDCRQCGLHYFACDKWCVSVSYKLCVAVSYKLWVVVFYIWNNFTCGNVLYSKTSRTFTNPPLRYIDPFN